MFPPLRAIALAVFATALSSSTVHAAPSAELAKLCDDYWQGYLRANPVFATSVGDGRYGDRLEDITPAGTEREDARLKAVLERAKAIEPRTLTAADQVTRSALLEEVQGQLTRSSCRLEDWVVDPLGGPQVEFMNLPDYTPLVAAPQGDRYVKRVRHMGRYFDDHIANLRHGLANGRVACRSAVAKTASAIARRGGNMEDAPSRGFVSGLRSREA